MSNIPPQRRPYDPSTPIEAEVIDESNLYGQHLPGAPRRKRSMLWPIVGWGLGALLLFGFVVGVITLAVIRTGSQNIVIDEKETPELAWEPTEHRDEISSTLDGSWQVSADDQRYARIRRQLFLLERAAATGDAEKMADLVDWDRYLARFMAAYRFKPLQGIERIWLKESAKEQFSMPDQGSDFRISAVKELTPDDWFVYAYAQEGEHIDIGYVFQFRRHGKHDWKLVDWSEALELQWQGTFYGLCAEPLLSDFEPGDQGQFFELIVESDDQHEQYELEAAKESLRQAEKLSGIEQLHDFNLHMIAVRWQMLGNSQEALRLCELADDPDSLPWLHYLATMCHSELGQHEQVVLAAEKCEQNAGFHVDVTIVKAQSLQELGREEEAAKASLAALRHRPDSAQVLSNAFAHVPVEQYAEMLELIGSEGDSLELLIQQTWRRLYDDDLEGFHAIRAYLAKHNPNNAQLMELDADLLHYQGKLEESLAMYQKYVARLKAEGKEEAWENAWSSLISVALLLQSHEELYEASTEKQELLKKLSEGIEYDEAYIGVAELAELLPRHRELAATDPRLPFYTALVAAFQQDFVAAKQAYEQAIAEFQESEADEYYQLEELQDSLLLVRYELGEALAAYDEADDQVAAYLTLASAMSADLQWNQLQKLNQVHRAEGQGTQLWQRFYELQIQEHAARQENDAELLSATLVSYQQLQQENEVEEDVYPYYLRWRINTLIAQSEQWLYFLRQHEDPVDLFTPLKTRFRSEQKPEELTKLVDYFQREHAESIVLFNHDLEQLWQEKNYAEYIDYVGEWPSERITQQYYAGNQQRERLVMSHLMVGNAAEALRVATEPEAMENRQMLVHMATGEVDAVKQVITSAEYAYFPLPPEPEWLEVPGIEEFLRSDTFRKMRTEIPLAAYDRGIAAHAMLLYKQAPAWNAQQIEQRLAAQGLTDVQVEAMSVDSTSFRLLAPEGECLLTLGSEPLLSEEELFDQVWQNEQLFVETAKAHEGWLALELPPSSTAEMETRWNQIIPAMLEETFVIYLSPGEGESLMLVEPESIAKLKQGEPLTSFSELKVSGSLPSGNSPQTNYYDAQSRQWLDKLRSAADESSLTGRIQIAIRQGSVKEHVWLQLQRVEHKNWGNYKLHGTMEQTSVLNPYLVAGDLIQVSPDEVLAWED